jgi:hypothetical protein
MKPYKEIGGYFGLELSNNSEYHSDAVALNSARNSFEYILRVRMPKIVYISKYICDAMIEPLRKLNIKYVFYSIDNNLEITDLIDVKNDEMLVYTNYFGIKDEYSNCLAEKFQQRIVIDCSQAFYYLPVSGEHVIYSPRKFFGVADGGYVITDKHLEQTLITDTSYDRMGHLLKRIDLGAEAGYDDFKHNDNSLVGESIKKMSRLTERILHSVDYEAVRERRLDNFRLLHNTLISDNELIISIDRIDAPMIYPYKRARAKDIRERLIQNKIFVATYWPNVLKWCEETELEYSLAEDIIPLPIDQRYDKDDMNRILKVIYAS